jgi:hypothetical protein
MPLQNFTMTSATTSYNGNMGSDAPMFISRYVSVTLPIVVLVGLLTYLTTASNFRLPTMIRHSSLQAKRKCPECR